MYQIDFYEDDKGYSAVKEFILDLRKHSATDKNKRINLQKTVAYLDALEQYGTRVGAPITKHLDGEIWELRPLKNRFLYAYYKENNFIILHVFIKKTRKTPKKELEKAKKNLADFLERNP